MTKNKLSFIQFALVAVCVTACTHSAINQNPNDQANQPNRAAALAVPTVTESRAPADIKSDDWLKKIIQTKDGNSNSLFNQMLRGIYAAQQLIASFDYRLQNSLSEKQIDQIYQSELYCKLMDVRTTFENEEENLAKGLMVARQLGNDSESWYYQQISNFAKGSELQKIAMMNLFRGFMDSEMEICGKKNCIAKDLDKISAFDFDPRDNVRFNLLVKKNLNSSDMKPSAMQMANDAKPGNCFSTAPAARTPQAAGYDWVNRNWVGSVLPEGHFIFTYDDGPHATYTRIIRDTWANAGLAKPTFFWLRQNVSSLSSIVKELNGQGYVIGSHSERHADLGTLAKSTSAADLNKVDRDLFAKEIAGLTGQAYINWRDKTLDREINQSVADLSVILGKPVRYFRLPYGSGVRNDLIGARFQALNLDHFFWRVDSLDWQDHNPDSIRDRVVGQMNVVKKGIILFHDIHPQSAAAAKLMVDYFLKNPSVKAVPVSDLPGLKP